MSRSSSGRWPIAVEQARVAGLGRAVGDQAVVERAAVGGMEHGGGGRAGIAVEQHRDAAHAGGHDGAGDGRELLAADGRQQRERIARGDRVAVVGERLVDDGDLVGERLALRRRCRGRPSRRRVPPNSAAHSVAAAVVLAMPISPRHSTSMPGSAAIMP